MKKHPVDDLFKTKLSNLEKKPSSDAWNRIRQGQDESQRKLPIWIWYVAAGLAMALLAGYSVWFTERGNLVPEIASVETPKSSVVQPQRANPVEGKLQKKTPLIADKSPEPNLSGVSSDRTPTVSKVNVENDERILKRQVEEAPMVSAENPSIAVAQVDIPDPVLSQETMKEIQPFVKSETENSSRTIVVKVTDEYDSLEQPRPSRFTRVFRQLKNARAGERVDWDEVGFNPRSVLARVDSKSRQ